MIDSEKKILNESLGKLFKMDPETLASLYNEAGELVNFSKILELDAERVAKYKKENNDQYNRGVKKGASDIEKELKEKYELDSDLLGVDLIDHLVVKKVEETKAAGTKDVTKHPDYIRLQVSIEKQLKDRDKDWEEKIKVREAEFNKAKIFEKVSKKGLTNLRVRNPILPSDPDKVQYWEDVYQNELRKRDYMENGDDLVVLGEDGKPLQNDHGNPITFNQFTNDIANKIFEFPKAEERSSAGLHIERGTGGDGFIPPKTEDEYMARLREPKITPKERIQLTEFWNAKK